MSGEGPAAEAGRSGDSNFYASAIGKELYRAEFTPPSEPCGGVVLVHGLGDHISRYDEIGALFASRGILAVGVDFPGHGYSPGPRGHVGSWDEVECVLRETIAYLRSRVGNDVRFGTMAHSMGAFIALKFLETSPKDFDFAWLSSPLIRPGAHRGPLYRKLVHAIAGVVPWVTVDSGVRESDCRPIHERSDRDPLWHHRVSIGWGRELLRLEREIPENLACLNAELALLVTHGEADVVCPADHSRELFDQIEVRDKNYVSIDEMMHDPFRGETHRAEVFAAVEEWLEGIGFARVTD